MIVLTSASENNLTVFKKRMRVISGRENNSCSLVDDKN